MSLSLVTAPAEKPVTLTQAKAHCRIDSTDEDTLITSLIAAATEHAEAITGRAFITQAWLYEIDHDWPQPKSGVQRIDLPLPPAQAVQQIDYIDTNGSTQTLAADQYRVDNNSIPGRITPAYGVSWPSVQCVTGAISISFTTGYGDEGDVPDAIKQAILLLIGHWYENRESSLVGISVNELPMGVSALLAPFKVHYL